MLRGLLLGLFSFAAFFLLLAVGLHRFGVAVAFLVATAAGLLIQGLTLRGVRARSDGAFP